MHHPISTRRGSPAERWVAVQSPSPSADLAAPGLWALATTPRVACLHRVWVLDVENTLRLWGGWPGVLQRLRSSWPWTHPLHLGVGPSPLAARARALVSPSADAAADAALIQALQALAATGPADQATTPFSAGAVPGLSPLAELPLHTLPELAAQEAVLARLGVTTWGQLDRLPRPGVVRRWGQGLLQTLDRAMGRQPHPLPWLQPPENFAQTLDLPYAAEHAPALDEPIRQLLATLCGWLQHRQQGALVLRWRLHHDPRRDLESPVSVLEVGLSQPVQQAEPLHRLTLEHVHRLNWVAPVVRLGLDLQQTQTWRGQAAVDLLHPAATAASPGPGAALQHSWPGLLDHLRARLGDAAVVQWQACRSPLTEASQTPQPRVSGTPLPVVRAEALPWAAAMPTWLALPPLPLAVRQGLPHYQGPLQLLSGPHRVEWADWTRPEAPACVRDHHLAHSPGAGLVWVGCDRAAPGSNPDAPARWWLLGWWA